MLTLTVPRAIPVACGVAGVLWGGPTVVALLTGGRSNLAFTALNLTIGTALLAFAVVTARIRVRLDPGRVELRALRGSQVVPRAQVRGILLAQDGGTPRLTVARRDGAPLSVGAWSLVARHDDGEREPAHEALARWGAETGVPVKVKRMTGPVQPPPRRPSS